MVVKYTPVGAINGNFTAASPASLLHRSEISTFGNLSSSGDACRTVFAEMSAIVSACFFFARDIYVGCSKCVYRIFMNFARPPNQELIFFSEGVKFDYGAEIRLFLHFRLWRLFPGFAATVDRFRPL